MTEQTAANFYAQVQGSVEALVLAFGALAAVQPDIERGKVLAAISKLAVHAADSPTDNEQTHNYKLGIRAAVAALVKSVETAQLAAEVLAVKRQAGSH